MGTDSKHREEGNYREEVNIEALASTINQCLLKYDDISFAFLFGSSARGEATTLSDVDIAVYFTGSVHFNRINSLREDLSGLLGKETDIVVLNNASPVIRMQVLKNGRLVADLDRRSYHEFFVNTVQEYDDLKRNRKQVEDAILRGRIYA